MPGTFGQSDLFKVTVNGDGLIQLKFRNQDQYRRKRNFPLCDENELYFASDGPGLGGLDIYVSKLKINKF
jgi:hypothetical protein